MDYQKIFEAVARHGRQHAIQIADRIDADPDEVQAQLTALVAVGDLVTSDGFRANGVAALFYDFSEAFKQGEVYALLTRKAEAANFTGDPGMSKVDRAIAFVRERGTATSSELHALLELKPEQTASTWLAGALRDGRLVRDGKNWTLGMIEKKPTAKPRASTFNTAPISSKSKGPVAQFPKTEPAVEVPSFLEKRVTVDSKPAGKAPELPTSEELASLPNEVLAQLSRPAQAKAAAAPTFRAGLWSDGTLELQRDGETIAKLQQDEGEQLAAFMQRMRVLLAA